MSNIYIQDPPTKGKVVLETTLGELEIELWPKEAPLACRNFVQLCLDGYYSDCIFHRIVPGLLAQSGDPTGLGRGGASAWGRPFKDEFHSRLRFGRRGLVACANANAPDSNGSQFFVTLGPAPQLDRKYTIFGRVVGDTQYNIPRFEQLELGEDDRPADPPVIKAASVPWNPFDDVVPRASPAAGEIQAPAAQKKTSALPAKQERRLMSFAEEEDEEDAVGPPGSEAARGVRSAHDVLEDATLSRQAAVQVDVARVQHALRAAREEKERGGSVGAGSLIAHDGPALQQSAAAGPSSARHSAAAGPSSAQHSVAAPPRARPGEEATTQESSDSEGSSGDQGALPSTLARQGKGKRSAPAAMAPSKQMTAADTELLSSWERRREEYKQRRRLGGHREKDTLARLERFRAALSRPGKEAAAAGPEAVPGEPEAPRPEAAGYEGRVAQELDHSAYMPAAWRMDEYLGGEKTEGDDLASLKSHRLEFAAHAKTGAMARKEEADDYIVLDPLLERGKQKFNLAQQRAKKRENAWAGKPKG